MWGLSHEQLGPAHETEHSEDSEGLRSLMKLLARYYGVKVAAILKHNAQGVKVIAGAGLMENDLPDQLGMDVFLKFGDIDCPDASMDLRFRTEQLVTGIWALRLVVVRQLICKSSRGSYFLLLADNRPRCPNEMPGKNSLSDIIQLIIEKFHIARIIRSVQELSREINARVEVLARLFDEVTLPVVSSAPDMKNLSVNEANYPYIALSPGDAKGKALKYLYPVHYKTFINLAHSIYNKKVATQVIVVEFDNKHGGNSSKYMQFTIFPLLDSKGDIVMIAGIACDVTVARAMEQEIRSNPISYGQGFQELSSPKENLSDPVLGFLLDTLVEQRALRSRNKVSYLTVRTWRKPIKAYQIKALKALKRSDPKGGALAIGNEIIDVVSSMVGTDSFDGIIAIPCGHSTGETCLSALIADTLSARTGLPVFRAFAPRPLAGSSHPKSSARMPPLKLRAEPAGHYLLVDDVATSGRHLEEAVELLRSAGAEAMAIAWVGGDKA